MLKHLAITAGRILEPTEGPGQILVAIGPDDSERALIKEQFLLDDFDLSAMLDPDEVPRLEVGE